MPRSTRTPGLRPVLTTVAALLVATAAVAAHAGPASTDTATMKPRAADWRTTIPATDFLDSAPGEWTSPAIRPPFAFDELIYSWAVRLPRGEGFRLLLQVGFPDGTRSPWLYAGYWGEVRDRVTSRTAPQFDRGIVDMDWLRLKKKAVTFQFRVTQASTAPLTVRPALNIVLTDNSPSRETLALADAIRPASPTATDRACILDLPFRRQMNSAGVITPNRCQSAALASAMEYFGKPVPLEDIVALTHEPEYDYPGVWPRIIAAAGEFGFDGTIDRFRDWDSVRAAVAQNKVILCSIRMKEGDCKEPPYVSMGNHIVALNGVTDDGRVVVTDSFLAKSGRGYRCQWLLEDFEKVWMETKQGIALVIMPPPGAERRCITDLPPFPAGRAPVRGDDH
jgi:hypothetical protein